MPSGSLAHRACICLKWMAANRSKWRKENVHELYSFFVKEGYYCETTYFLDVKHTIQNFVDAYEAIAEVERELGKSDEKDDKRN